MSMMMIMPAVAGSCAICATKHEAHLPHNLTSISYEMRFKMAHGRDPTWADCCAHLTAEQTKAWRAAMRASNVKWSAPKRGVKPIAEPYSVSDGLTPMLRKESANV